MRPFSRSSAERDGRVETVTILAIGWMIGALAGYALAGTFSTPKPQPPDRGRDRRSGQGKPPDTAAGSAEPAGWPVVRVATSPPLVTSGGS